MRGLLSLATVAAMSILFTPGASSAQNPQGFCEDCFPETSTCITLTKGYNGCNDGGSGGGWCSVIPYDHCDIRQEISVSPSGIVDTSDAPAFTMAGVAYGGCRSWVVGLPDLDADLERADAQMRAIRI